MGCESKWWKVCTLFGGQLHKWQEKNLCYVDSINNLRIREDGFIDGGVDCSSYLILWTFFTTTNHFPENSVKYMGSNPIKEGMLRRRILSPEFIIVVGMLRMGTISVWARKQFCWVIRFLAVIASVDWIRSWEMKWMLKSDGGVRFKTDDLISRDFYRVALAG